MRRGKFPPEKNLTAYSGQNACAALLCKLPQIQRFLYPLLGTVERQGCEEGQLIMPRPRQGKGAGVLPFRHRRGESQPEPGATELPEAVVPRREP